VTRVGNSAGRRRRGAAFTLIELLAVVAIFALMAAFVMPNLATLGSRTLRRQAQHIGGQLELARQRSIVTGIPHRMWLDLDSASYRLEWNVSEAETEGEAAPTAATDPHAAVPLSLAPPRETERQYRSLPGRLGRARPLESSLTIAGLETPGGWIERGEAFIAFERDGTTVYTAIVLEDESGRSVTLEILPLADAVRIRDESS
jgi:type II secretion system protein H